MPSDDQHAARRRTAARTPDPRSGSSDDCWSRAFILDTRATLVRRGRRQPGHAGYLVGVATGARAQVADRHAARSCWSAAACSWSAPQQRGHRPAAGPLRRPGRASSTRGRRATTSCRSGSPSSTAEVARASPTRSTTTPCSRSRREVEALEDPAGLDPAQRAGRHGHPLRRSRGGRSTPPTGDNEPAGRPPAGHPGRGQRDVEGRRQAVTIQGQRVVTTTGIKCEGNSVHAPGRALPPALRHRGGRRPGDADQARSPTTTTCRSTASRPTTPTSPSAGTSTSRTRSPRRRTTACSTSPTPTPIRRVGAGGRLGGGHRRRRDRGRPSVGGRRRRGRRRGRRLDVETNDRDRRALRRRLVRRAASGR